MQDYGLEVYRLLYRIKINLCATSPALGITLLPEELDENKHF